MRKLKACTLQLCTYSTPYVSPGMQAQTANDVPDAAIQ